jgi:hypothetical protein
LAQVARLEAKSAVSRQFPDAHGMASTGIPLHMNFNQKKIVCMALVFVLGTVFIGFSILSAKTDPDNDSVHRQRPPVLFFEKYHDRHMENQDCLDCHHKYKNGENILDEGDLEDGDPEIYCASCHNNNEKYDLQQAFHRQCMGCHDRLSAANMKTGPSLCGECHVSTKTG